MISHIVQALTGAIFAEVKSIVIDDGSLNIFIAVSVVTNHVAKMPLHKSPSVPARRCAVVPVTGALTLIDARLQKIKTPCWNNMAKKERKRKDSAGSQHHTK